MLTHKLDTILLTASVVRAVFSSATYASNHNHGHRYYTKAAQI